MQVTWKQQWLYTVKIFNHQDQIDNILYILLLCMCMCRSLLQSVNSHIWWHTRLFIGFSPTQPAYNKPWRLFIAYFEFKLKSLVTVWLIDAPNTLLPLCVYSAWLQFSYVQDQVLLQASTQGHTIKPAFSGSSNTCLGQLGQWMAYKCLSLIPKPTF